MAVWFLSVFMLLVGIATSVQAAGSPWAEHQEVRTRLIIAGVDRDAGVIHAGLEMKLAAGWHAYWRTPGDGGIAPRLNWEGSKNIGAVTLRWPAPYRQIDFDVIETYAYRNHVVLPLEIGLAAGASEAKLKLHVEYGVCDEICVFFEDDHAVSVPANMPVALDGEAHALLENFRAKIPMPQGSNGLFIDEARLIGEANSPVLSVIARAEQGFVTAAHSPDIFVELNENFRFPKPEISMNEAGTQAVFNIPAEMLLAGENLSEREVTLTLVNGDAAVERQLTLPRLTAPAGDEKPGAPGAGEPASTAPVNLLYILLAAFLGGLILNVMPCVLPVLSLKVMGVLRHGGGNAGGVRSSFLWSAAGIIVSFMVLAGLVIALKAGGQAVNWGFHFQEPLFVFTILAVINLFAASQLGLFEVQLPSWLGGNINSALDKTTAAEKQHSPMGNFMLGAFATLLATPCSAPFLGTAISFALARGVEEILLIFFVLGVGLAAPYLLFALLPKLVTKLPRPGAWMKWVKLLLALLLVATSLWLAAVLFAQLMLKDFGLLLLLSLLPVAGYGLLKHSAWFIKLGVFILALAVGYAMPTQSSREAAQNAGWVAYDAGRLQAAIDDGRTVFVDVTADWCLTCKWNKLNVTDSAPVQAAFAEGNVLLMRADYTKPSEDIKAYLARYDRYGIPFNIVYGTAAKEGISLPELLTEQAVLDALALASAVPSVQK